ncbi:ATP-binding protein [Pyrococcus kukulkanii]|uniref:ATP-binding protein n=1 Tax=Pyrococcus kukulkanii TaxID=1609559 RepID=UPI001D108FB5|nr:DUF4143 domain-containing protein [Pyrococcus kukulkanii]
MITSDGGGFPEVWTFKSREKIISIVETVFYRDIIERFKIREIKEFEDFFYYVLSLYSSYFTYRSLQRALASWIKLSVKTVMNYLKYMESSMLIYTLPTFSPSQREIIRRPKKLYIVDHGLANLFFRGMDMGRRIENVVFLELLRRKLYRNPLLKIFYYSGSEGEVDFVLMEGNKVIELIQVTVEVTPANYRREVEGLIKVGKKLKCNNLTLVTLERSEVDGVKVIPLWEFLLSS